MIPLVRGFCKKGIQYKIFSEIFMISNYSVLQLSTNIVEAQIFEWNKSHGFLSVRSFDMQYLMWTVSILTEFNTLTYMMFSNTVIPVCYNFGQKTGGLNTS